MNLVAKVQTPVLALWLTSLAPLSANGCLTSDAYAENLIKLHKPQPKSDRTSCRSANANQMRLVLNTAAYWLVWAVRCALPPIVALRTAEFDTIRARLLKVSARVIQNASRSRIASPAPVRMPRSSAPSLSAYVPQAHDGRGGGWTRKPFSSTSEPDNPAMEKALRVRTSDRHEPRSLATPNPSYSVGGSFGGGDRSVTH